VTRLNASAPAGQALARGADQSRRRAPCCAPRWPVPRPFAPRAAYGLAAPRTKMSPRRSPTSACVAAAILISLRAAAASPSFASGIKGGGLSLLLPGGDEVYPSCAVQKIVDFKTLSDCAICTNSNKHGALNSEACKSCCADSVTGSSNQAVVCTVGGCCIRLLLDLSTNSTVFVAEELTATGRDSGSTACVLAESAACAKCALGANGGNLVSCPNGFAIPVRLTAPAGR
jgi:hypothetical protein